ncbi:MAG: sialate O-acetylesterase [Nibricoccus sp.]
MQKLLQGILLGACLAIAAHADVTIASLFQDHAVLQRDQPVPVWGWAEPGEKVTVEFRGQSVITTTDAKGSWQVRLESMKASEEPAALIVRGKNTLTISDVLTGEVWLASGQSNMEFRVEQANAAATEIAAAKYPLIRHFDVPNLVADSPKTSTAGSWVVCSPETAGKFSAVAYYFARDLRKAANVPVGIINSTWGGTPVESWMSGTTLGSQPEFRAPLDRWQKTIAEYPQKKAEYDAALPVWEKADAAALANGKPAQATFRKANPKPRLPRGPGHHWTPAGLYNGMIAPLVPYALNGAIWYQAESNADYPAEYTALFSAMINQWRAEWGREFPFYFVQIANFNGTPADRTPGQWAWLRDAQAKTLALPATGMAVTIDIGTPADIHPRNKQDVGRRLALIARHELLGEKIEFSGPQFVRSETVGTSLRLTFTHADGLNSSRGAPADFVIAGEDRVFHPAEARIEGEAVVVTCAAVSKPVAVRYAWSNAPTATLRNGAGLPAAPFRSDDWKN